MMLAKYMPSRYLFAMLAAAFVFVFASAAIGPGAGSFAQEAAQPFSTDPAGATSQGDLQTAGTSPDGARRSCADIPEARGGFLLGRIIPCLTKTIETGASKFSRAMIAWLMPTFYAFLTFIIVIFGVQVLQNEGQLQARAFVLLLKIGFALTLLAIIPGDETTGEGGLIGLSYSIMAETQASVMSALGPDDTSMHCPMEHFGDANTPMIWAQMDCLLSKFYGFAVGAPGPDGEAKPSMLLASSILGMLGGFFFSSTFGAALFFASHWRGMMDYSSRCSHTSVRAFPVLF